MKKNQYEKPDIEVIKICDVITASGEETPIKIGDDFFDDFAN